MMGAFLCMFFYQKQVKVFILSALRLRLRIFLNFNLSLDLYFSQEFRINSITHT